MKNKLIMVFGAGGGKLFPILFGLYLSRYFELIDFTGFILVITYATALMAIATMGSAPQLMRSGAVSDPEKHIVTVVAVGFLLTGLLLILSLIYWLLLAKTNFLSDKGSLSLYYLSAMAIGIICYSISQAIFNVEQKFRLAGVSSVIIYGGSTIVGVVIGSLYNSSIFALAAYFSFYAFASLVFFIKSQQSYLGAWRLVRQDTQAIDWLLAVRTALSTSVFGLIILGGFFIIMAIVHARLSVQDSAVFAMSFQLFQAGIFVPSVLGSIVVPKMVLAAKSADSDSERRVHKQTQLLYLIIGIGWTVVVALFAYPLLSLYGFSENRESVLAVIFFQVAGVFAVMQAYHIQKCVSSGSFGLLAVAAIVWLAVALIFLEFTGHNLLSAVFSLVVAYGVSFLFYEGYAGLLKRKKSAV